MRGRPKGRKATLAISLGDPAGIGVEVTLGALAKRRARAAADVLLVGNREAFEQSARALDFSLTTCAADEEGSSRCIPFLDADRQHLPGPGQPRSAKARAACGEAAFRSIVAATELVLEGRADALVTAPICKEHIGLAGHDFPGHTELLAELAGGVPVRMMLAGPRLRVVLVTIHMALSEVPTSITTDNILETIRITASSLRHRFAIEKPRIAVCGLNPHAGEGGLFGDEEKRIIAPAVVRARRASIRVEGPLAADGIFAHAAQGAFDAVICMYHDQGLGPFKLMHFADGVNCTLGLPFVRTSPDHGTAFDIAGQGKADPSSMLAAIEMAAQLT